MSPFRTRKCPHCQHGYIPGRGGYTIDGDHNVRCSRCGKVIQAGTEGEEEEASAPYMRPSRAAEAGRHHGYGATTGGYPHHHHHHQGRGGTVATGTVLTTTLADKPWTGEDYD